MKKEKRSRPVTQLSTSRIPGGFTEKTARVNGVTLNYATGGTGPAVVLLHGYPQTWYMWRKVMPALAGQYTVIAPDLRGSGGSDAPATGYDKASLAADIHQLLLALGHAGEVSVVGHDIGGTVAYAYAAAHRDSVRRLAVIEAPQIDESLYQFPSVTPAGPGFWNFGFFMLGNGLPESMVSGREDAWISPWQRAAAGRWTARGGGRGGTPKGPGPPGGGPGGGGGGPACPPRGRPPRRPAGRAAAAWSALNWPPARPRPNPQTGGDER